MKSGYEVKYHHHEQGIDQHEIEIRSLNAVPAADYCIYFKQLARETACCNELQVTFMPKPFANTPGNGMHIHLALYQQGRNMFVDENEEYNLSQTARYFIGGILDHVQAIAGIGNPTVNSYKRLTPDYEAPVYITWAARNRSSLIRIPAKKNVDVEVRNPDPAANPYLLLAVIIRSGLEGIKKKIQHRSVEKNLYQMEEEGKKRSLSKLPGNLMDALEELENDDLVRETLGEEALSLFMEKKRKNGVDITRKSPISNTLFIFTVK
jgi:glutamine synthetase